MYFNSNIADMYISFMREKNNLTLCFMHAVMYLIITALQNKAT